MSPKMRVEARRACRPLWALSRGSWLVHDLHTGRAWREGLTARCRLLFVCWECVEARSKAGDVLWVWDAARIRALYEQGLAAIGPVDRTWSSGVLSEASGPGGCSSMAVWAPSRAGRVPRALWSAAGTSRATCTRTRSPGAFVLATVQRHDGASLSAAATVRLGGDVREDAHNLIYFFSSPPVPERQLIGSPRSCQSRIAAVQDAGGPSCIPPGGFGRYMIDDTCCRIVEASALGLTTTCFFCRK